MTELLYPYCTEEEFKRESKRKGNRKAGTQRLVSERKRKADKRNDERASRRVWQQFREALELENMMRSN